MTRIVLTLIAITTARADPPAQPDPPVQAALDHRGWHEGTVAAASDEVLAGPTPEAVVLPEVVDQLVDRPTLLIYYSPTCPHCRAVAPELVRLSASLGDRAKLVWVATGSQSELSVKEFVDEFGIKGTSLQDTDRNISAALGARYTPSVLLVDRERRKVVVRDLWYPYRPGNDTLVRLRLAEEPWSVFAAGQYHGNNSCGACHVEEMRSWKLSHHSIAWMTLVDRNRHFDAKCTSCHVTGAGAVGGWDGDAHSPLVDVGCEACHGPGGPHDGVPTAPASTCEACHDTDHSIAFAYTRGLPHLDHFVANSMDDNTYETARRAIFNGEVKQHLVAFPEGETVGSDACEACHAEEYAWWTDSDHARAMATLPEASRDQVDCVRCHATPNKTGLPAATVDGYRRDESVGCESCHGAGTDHIAAGGGTDNIQGLGDSCPVCVLEALCTSCHTPEWDASWNLDRRLLGVEHRGPTHAPQP